MTKLQKLCYSFGAVATALSYQAFSTFIIFFYVDTLRLPANLAAVAMLIYGIWNAINDPVAGHISDSTRTRFGRRIPYVIFGAIPFGIIYFLVWTPMVDASNASHLFLYFLAVICLFDTMYTVVVLNWASLFPEMFRSLKERAEVNSYRQTFGMVGLVIGIALPPLIYSSIGWSGMGLIFGALIAAAYLVSVAGSREDRGRTDQKAMPFREAVRATFANVPFVVFVSSNLLIQYAFTMVLAIMPFYAKYILNAKPYQTSLVLFAAFAVAIPMMFVWRGIAGRTGARASYIASIALFLMTLLPFLFIRELALAVTASALLGAGLAGIILLSDVLISDVIDHDAKITGRRREGMYFGVNAFVCRFAIALEAASIGWVFSWAKYNPVIFTQSQSFVLGLRLLMAGLPIATLILALAIMSRYPLSGKPAE